MPLVVYVESSGRRHGADVEVGSSVMRGAVDAGIAGLDAVCGGQCVCATCHCIVDDAWFEKLPEIGELEEELLDSVTGGRTPRSRLSCQIEVTSELHGLVVHVPLRQ